MPKTFVTATRSPLQPIMDRFVPRDDRSFVMASQSCLATTPFPSLRAQRGNPFAPSLRAQRGSPHQIVTASAAWQSMTPRSHRLGTTQER